MNIFYDDRVIRLVTQDEEKYLPFHAVKTADEVKKAIDQFIKTESLTEMVLASDDFRGLKQIALDSRPLIKAAGGVVVNEKKEILFIFRRGKWDLPKGKLESGYSSVESEAMREVKEETGLMELTIRRELETTFHFICKKSGEQIKVTRWFEMVASKNQPLVPQIAEEITDVRWFQMNQLDQVLRNTYESLRNLIHQYQVT